MSSTEQEKQEKTIHDLDYKLTGIEVSDAKFCEYDDSKPFHVPRIYIAIAAGIMLCTATYDTLGTKYQNRLLLPKCENCEISYFEAPMFQTFVGYLGELLCLLLFKFEALWSLKKNRQNRLNFSSSDDMKKPHAPKLIWILPALSDIACTLCINIASMLTQASIVQVLRAWCIIPTFLLSVYVLKNKVYWHQIFGILLVVVGTGLTGYNAIAHPDLETNHSDSQWIGVLAAILGTCMAAVQFLIEEAIFRYYQCSPFESIGYSGVYGCIGGAILLVAAHYTKYEDMSVTFYRLTSNSKESLLLLLTSLLYVFSVGTHTVSGILITKLASSLLRVILNSGRIVTVYFFALIFGWESFLALHLVGVLTILLAIILYNYSYIKSSQQNGFALTNFCVIQFPAYQRNMRLLLTKRN